MANCNHSDNLFWNLCFYFEMSKTLWVFRSPLSSEVQSTWIPNNQAEVMTWGWSSCLRLCGFPPRQLPLWAAFRSWKTCNAPYTLAYLSWEMNFPQLYISNQLCCGRGWAKVISAPWERGFQPGGIRAYLQNKDRTCGGNHPAGGWEFLHCQTLNGGFSVCENIIGMYLSEQPGTNWMKK